MDLIISVGLAVLLFVCFAIGYKEGLRLGMRSAKCIEPKPIKNPVKAVKDAIKAHEIEKEAKEQENIYDAIEHNDGYTEIERNWIKGGGRR